MSIAKDRARRRLRDGPHVKGRVRAEAQGSVLRRRFNVLPGLLTTGRGWKKHTGKKKKMEAASGFEPLNGSVADCYLNRLGTPPHSDI